MASSHWSLLYEETVRYKKKLKACRKLIYNRDESDYASVTKPSFIPA